MITAFDNDFTSKPHVLHVFEQDGGWHWGITVPRSPAGGFRVIAFSDRAFRHEVDARHDGSNAMGTLVAG
ncbi:hypothetical protein G5S35_30065 [Paraburkholderia tropica]|uniref:hypothetical protein n=1 Tax=Paraburkholderia tropica TaxID=92647 RepID=UPI001600194D|nr:hypothetical protein [Paraburkholderia tropica]QNB15814.1 hypothetical protein G5S35_30065 [Paraburkholderia tropica]